MNVRRMEKPNNFSLLMYILFTSENNGKKTSMKIKQLKCNKYNDVHIICKSICIFKPRSCKIMLRVQNKLSKVVIKI